VEVGAEKSLMLFIMATMYFRISLWVNQSASKTDKLELAAA